MNNSPKKTPGGVKKAAVVDAMKQLLSDPTAKIKLDDFVTSHVKRFIEETNIEHFPVQASSVSKEDFLERLGKYEEATREISDIVILLAYWGDQTQLSLLEKIFKRISETDKGSSGTVLWLKLGWYPLMLLMYVAGIAALSKKRFDVLKIVLETEIRITHKYDGKGVPLVLPVFSSITDLHDNFKLIPGRERNHTPRSEHLLQLLQPQLEDLLFLGQGYEMLFDEFEVFIALVYADFASGDWGPPGRFAWKYSNPISADNPFRELMEKAKKAADTWEPLRKGFFGGSYKRFEEISGIYQKQLDQLHWW